MCDKLIYRLPRWMVFCRIGTRSPGVDRVQAPIRRDTRSNPLYHTNTNSLAASLAVPSTRLSYQRTLSRCILGVNPLHSLLSLSIPSAVPSLLTPLSLQGRLLRSGFGDKGSSPSWRASSSACCNEEKLSFRPTTSHNAGCAATSQLIRDSLFGLLMASPSTAERSVTLTTNAASTRR